MLQRIRQLLNENARIIWYAFLVIIVIAAAGFAYKTFFYRSPATGIFQPAQPADGMASVPTHETAPVALKAYDKKKAVKLMGIPEITLAPPELELVATSKTGKDREGYSTTSAAIADTTTGKVEIIEKKERSLFSFGGRSEIGVRGGIGSSGQQADIYARQDLVRVGNVYVAGYGEATGSATGDAGAKAMIDVSWRW
jgi:hypothetical protein